jgi:hypothetical protein
MTSIAFLPGSRAPSVASGQPRRSCDPMKLAEATQSRRSQLRPALRKRCHFSRRCFVLWRSGCCQSAAGQGDPHGTRERSLDRRSPSHHSSHGCRASRAQGSGPGRRLRRHGRRILRQPNAGTQASCLQSKTRKASSYGWGPFSVHIRWLRNT